MEELLELREKLLLGDISGALAIVEDLEEMSKDDKINNMRSFAVVLLKHLIKQQVEKRSTKSWEVSIFNSAKEIQERNKRRKTKRVYLNQEELVDLLNAAYKNAINSASLEVKEGKYDPSELEAMVDKDTILNQAMIQIESN